MGRQLALAAALLALLAAPAPAAAKLGLPWHPWAAAAPKPTVDDAPQWPDPKATAAAPPGPAETGMAAATTAVDTYATAPGYSAFPWTFEAEAWLFMTAPQPAAPAPPPAYAGLPPLPFVGGPGMLSIIRYSNSNIGAYSELLWSPGAYKPDCADAAQSVARIWVDSQFSMRAGRNEMARFEWTVEGGVTRVTVVEHASGRTIFTAALSDVPVPRPLIAKGLAALDWLAPGARCLNNVQWPIDDHTGAGESLSRYAGVAAYAVTQAAAAARPPAALQTRLCLDLSNAAVAQLSAVSVDPLAFTGRDGGAVAVIPLGARLPAGSRAHYGAPAQVVLSGGAMSAAPDGKRRAGPATRAQAAAAAASAAAPAAAQRKAGAGEEAGSPLPELPEPLVLHVLSLWPPALQACAAKLVCKAARERFRGTRAGQLAVLEWARGEGLDLRSVCEAAAWVGQLAVLRWAREQTPPLPWGDFVWYSAAERGDLEMLRWARAQAEPAPWAKEVCRRAAVNGQLEALRWLRANGCPWRRCNCEFMAQSIGHEAMIAWIRAQPAADDD
ncbi:hypothetical protein HT031_004038 [Scenedesmus sp. PABB004]|nr:hypothetical protein HT031_004038 [Scenedesmus sp. PABB004]